MHREDPRFWALYVASDNSVATRYSFFRERFDRSAIGKKSQADIENA